MGSARSRRRALVQVQPAWFPRCGKREQTAMKDSMDATAARQAPEHTDEEFVSRKLIRPSLSTPPPRTEPVSERRERLERTDRMHSNGPRRNGASEQTHAENYYYQKQIQGKTPVVVVLKDGEQVQEIGRASWRER